MKTTTRPRPPAVTAFRESPNTSSVALWGAGNAVAKAAPTGPRGSTATVRDRSEPSGSSSVLLCLLWGSTVSSSFGLIWHYLQRAHLWNPQMVWTPHQILWKHDIGMYRSCIDTHLRAGVSGCGRETEWLLYLWMDNVRVVVLLFFTTSVNLRIVPGPPDCCISDIVRNGIMCSESNAAPCIGE